MRGVTLKTKLDALTFDLDTGRLVGLSPLDDPGLNLIAPRDDHPAFVLQYLAEGEYVVLDSRQAKLSATHDGPSLTLAFSQVGGLDLDVTLTVTASPADRFSRWSATVRNGAGLQIVDLQFPFVVVPDEPDGDAAAAGGAGACSPAATSSRTCPADEPRRWQFWPENGNSQHYPGRSFAQFLAWYTPRRRAVPGLRRHRRAT